MNDDRGAGWTWDGLMEGCLSAVAWSGSNKDPIRSSRTVINDRVITSAEWKWSPSKTINANRNKAKSLWCVKKCKRGKNPVAYAHTHITTYAVEGPWGCLKCSIHHCQSPFSLGRQVWKMFLWPQVAKLRWEGDWINGKGRRRIKTQQQASHKPCISRLGFPIQVSEIGLSRPTWSCLFIKVLPYLLNATPPQKDALIDWSGWRHKCKANNLRQWKKPGGLGQPAKRHWNGKQASVLYIGARSPDTPYNTSCHNSPSWPPCLPHLHCNILPCAPRICRLPHRWWGREIVFQNTPAVSFRK